MLRSSLIAFGLLLATSTFAFSADAVNTLSDTEEAAGWKLLFDGKSATGWVAIGKAEFPTKGWSIVDGVLLHAKGGGGGDIVTAKEYENFDLTWDWKIGQVGNSGLKYNLPDPSKGVGFEYQMLDDENHPDGKRGGGLHQTGGLYDLLEPAAGKTIKPVGEWNRSRIVMNGNRVEHWLNGAKTLEFELGSPELTAAIANSKYKTIAKFGEKTKSPILIQDHGDEVAIRSIKLRVLPGK